jgi:hypothetical protein
MTPLQYVYEAADCRIFYTSVSWRDPEAAWRQAWDAFGDRERCVEGSTRHRSSIRGGYRPFGSGELGAGEMIGGDGDGTGNGTGAGSGMGSGGKSTVAPSSPMGPRAPESASAAREPRKLRSSRWTMFGMTSGLFVALW